MNEKELTSSFKALSCETRRKIIYLLKINFLQGGSAGGPGGGLWAGGPPPDRPPYLQTYGLTVGFLLITIL